MILLRRFLDPNPTSLNPLYRWRFSGSRPSKPTSICREGRGASVKNAQRSSCRGRQFSRPRKKRIDGYFRHEISGGMRKRVVIAARDLREPGIEFHRRRSRPTALDVSVQAQIISLINGWGAITAPP